MYLVGQRYNYVGEDEENWDTISLSSFNAIMCFTVMPFISLYLPIM